MSSEKKRTHEPDATVVYWGEQECDVEKCRNKAYYWVRVPLKKNDRRYLCGVHSSHNKQGQRTELQKNPRADELREQLLKEREQLVEEAAAKNRSEGKHGSVVCSKLRMMRQPEHLDGYRKVFANYKHQNRRDGYGCRALSPKALGPVPHDQPGVPESLSIENYHQFNKVFPCEADSDGNPKAEFYERRNAAYRDPVPHRHKFSASEMRAMGLKNKNVPLYSLHLDKEGKERRYTYVESRYFYCHWYERLAKQTNDYKHLCQMLDAGYNLQIVGYDSYDVDRELYEHYQDASRPFGHELVLYTLLTVADRNDYPWRRFRREHPALYDFMDQ